jgi:thioredoxin 2
MNTLQIVCPHCQKVSPVTNEVAKNELPCRSCGGSLLETAPLECDDAVFRTQVADNDIPVLADFYSPDCAPCMGMAPAYAEVAASFALEVRFLKINVLEYPHLARQYGVNMLPTIIAFKNGREVNRFSSALSKEQLRMWGESLIQMVI